MAATHAASVLKTASTSVSAGATDTATQVDNTAAYGGIINIVVTNGSSAPTTAPVLNIYSDPVTTTKSVPLYSVALSQVNSFVNKVPFRVPKDAMFVNVELVNGATNAVTWGVTYQATTGQ